MSAFYGKIQKIHYWDNKWNPHHQLSLMANKNKKLKKFWSHTDIETSYNIGQDGLGMRTLDSGGQHGTLKIHQTRFKNSMTGFQKR